MNLNILEILVLVSLIQGVLFSIVIITQNFFKVKANKYLAYSIFLLSYIGIAELIMAKDLHKDNYLISYFVDGIPWLFLFYIPMLIYFLRSANNKFGRSKKMILLVIPFLIFFILSNLVILHHEYKLINFHFIQEKHELISDFEYYSSLLFNIVLCILSYFVIKSGDISFNEKKWLRNIWLFSATLIFIWIIDSFIPENSLPYTNKEITYPVWFGVSIFVYWLIFKGLIQLKLSQDISEINSLLKKTDNSETVTLEREIDIKKEHSKKAHFQRFKILMEQEKLYRNPDLSRDIVAEKLNMSTGYLSQLINASVNSNFTTLTNNYRIDDVKNMLLNSDFNKYSIVAIGLEAGFKSKSTFYSEFKKKTGYTPNQFKLVKRSPN